MSNVLGKWIAGARHAAGMTQPEFGRRIGLGTSPAVQVTISRWERGVRKPGAIALLNILAVLSKKPSDLPGKW